MSAHAHEEMRPGSDSRATRKRWPCFAYSVNLGPSRDRQEPTHPPQEQDPLHYHRMSFNLAGEASYIRILVE
jgi:hypothetical protein